MIRYLIAWLVLLVIAVANGFLRQLTYGKRMAELRAHQLSTLTGAVAVGAAIWCIVRLWPPSSAAEALLIGAIWLALTVAFEFFMGLVLARRPLREVLHDYNLLAGRVWVLFLIWLTLAPWVFYELR
jgi:hypothetical protein